MSEAKYYLRRCRTLRELAKLKQVKLASEAEVDRSRISLIEKNHGVTRNIIMSVFYALQKHHPDIKEDEEVSIK